MTPVKVVPRLMIRQIRSGIGFEADQKATLRALGLGRIGRVRSGQTDRADDVADLQTRRFEDDGGATLGDGHRLVDR